MRAYRGQGDTLLSVLDATRFVRASEERVVRTQLSTYVCLHIPRLFFFNEAAVPRSFDGSACNFHTTSTVSKRDSFLDLIHPRDVATKSRLFQIDPTFIDLALSSQRSVTFPGNILRALSQHF